MLLVDVAVDRHLVDDPGESRHLLLHEVCFLIPVALGTVGRAQRGLLSGCHGVSVGLGSGMLSDARYCGRRGKLAWRWRTISPSRER